MSDDIIQAKYADIQAQHDIITSAINAAEEAKEACGQAFNALAPCYVGASGGAAQTASQQNLQGFDDVLTDMRATQQQGMTQVEELAGLDHKLSGMF